MAYQKKRSYRKKQEIGLTPDAVFWMCNGFMLDGMIEPDEKQAEKLWRLHRKDLIRAYCSSNPGRLPHFFWVCDAPQEAAHDDRERGFFAYRQKTNKRDMRGYAFEETEYQTIVRLGLLQTVKKLGYQMPTKISENMGTDSLH